MPLKQHKSSNFPLEFQHESLNLVNSLVPCTSSVFCLVEPDMKSRGTVLKGVSNEMDFDYHNKHNKNDPASPVNFSEKDELVICLRKSHSIDELQTSIFYQDFLKPNNIEDAVDLRFRQEGRIIATITMLRDSSLPLFSTGELDMLKSTQRFLQYSLDQVYLSSRVSQHQLLTDKFQLTTRELDVLECVITGSENKLIADELSISLATVKTHLDHIFKKFDVSSRTKLLSKVFSEIGK